MTLWPGHIEGWPVPGSNDSGRQVLRTAMQCTRQLLDKLLQLSANDRALIAAELNASLDTREEDAKARGDEIRRRVDDIEKDAPSIFEPEQHACCARRDVSMRPSAPPPRG